MQYIASETAWTSSPENSLSVSALNIQDGDVLVTILGGDIARSLTLTVADQNGDSSHTVLAWSSAWLRVRMGYCVSADANSSATITATLSGDSNGGWGMIVYQFRPESGETIAFGDGPASFGSNWDDNPASASLSSSGAAMFVGCSIHTEPLSNAQIAGASCDGTESIAETENILSGYTEFSSTQSSITFSSSSSNQDGTCGAQMLYLTITESGGASANSYYYMMNQ